MNDSIHTAESTAKRKLSRKEAAALILAATLVLAAGFYTLSKYTSDKAEGTTVEMEDFYAVLKAYTVETDVEGTTTRTEETYDIDQDRITVDIDDFDTMQLDFVYTGEAMTYCRFKVDLSFLRDYDTDTDSDGTDEEVTQTVPHDYAVTAAENTYGDDDSIEIYDNTETDGWYYITDIMSGDTTLETVLEITDTGEDAEDLLDDDDAAQYVEIVVTVDCVQFNRVLALWDIDTLPWK